MDTITNETLERYLATSNLTESQKQSLRAEFKSTNGSKDVLTKAVSLNGRKSMGKVPKTIPNK